MPPRARRPAPLSDEAIVTKQQGQNNVLYGATNNGVPLPIKNTFIDVPSGHTPTSMRGAANLGATLVTAPPILDKPPGLSMMKQALVQSPAASPVSARRLVYSGLPLETPSPNAATAQIRVLHAAFGPVYDYQCSYAPRAPVTVWPQTLEQQPEDDDDEDDDDEIVPPHLRNLADAPQPPPGALHPSLGSELHDQQQCKRCCFFPRGRCTNGYNCEFCHYEHEKRKRKNKKKKKKGAPEFFMGTAVSSGASVAPLPPAPAAPSSQVISQLPAAPPPPPAAAVPPHTYTYAPHMLHHATAPTYVSSYVAAPPPPVPPMGPPTLSPTITAQYQYAIAPSQPPPTAVFTAPLAPVVQSVAHLQSVPHVPPPPPSHQPGIAVQQAVQQVHASPQSIPMPPSTTVVVVKPQAHSPPQIHFSPPPVDAPSLPTAEVMAPPPMQSPKFSLSPGTREGVSPPPMQSPKFGSVAGGQMMPPPLVSPKFSGNVAQALEAAASSPGTYIAAPNLAA